MKEEDTILSEFRKQIADMLRQFGYHCHTFNPQEDFVKEPRPEGREVEQDIKKFNLGEAYYRAEDVAGTVDTLFFPAYHDPQKLNECREEFKDLLQYGMEFTYEPHPEEKSYGLVNLIDSMHPEMNAFRVVQNWENAAHDGFQWDFVITVNSMPLAVVVLEPTQPGHDPLQDAYDVLNQELEKDPCLSTYVQFCIISDGIRSWVGNDFQAEGELFKDPLKAFSSILLPERLLDLLQHTDEGEDTVSYETPFFHSILSQLAVVKQEFGSFQQDSAYYEISQEAVHEIDQFLENVPDQFDSLEEEKGGYLESTPLETEEKGGALKTPPFEAERKDSGLQPTALETDEKGGVLKTPPSKAKYRPQKEVYTEDPVEQERITQGIRAFLMIYTDPNSKKDLKIGERWTAPSYVIACLWSACAEHLENVHKGDVMAFYRLFNAARDVLPTERKFGLSYSAIIKKPQTWKELYLGYNSYEPLYLHNISLEQVENDEDKATLAKWKRLYDIVVALAREVQLLPPFISKDIPEEKGK